MILDGSRQMAPAVVVDVQQLAVVAVTQRGRLSEQIAVRIGAAVLDGSPVLVGEMQVPLIGLGHGPGITFGGERFKLLQRVFSPGFRVADGCRGRCSFGFPVAHSRLLLRFGSELLTNKTKIRPKAGKPGNGWPAWGRCHPAGRHRQGFPGQRRPVLMA